MATLKAVSAEILNDLEKTSKLTRFIGASLQSETLDRIFTRGIATDGGKIGDYSIYTINNKKQNGRFTSSSVNLRNTDTLANSYVFDFTDDRLELGFSQNSRTGDDGKKVNNSDLIPKLEKQYGEIFGLTSDELKLVEDLTDDFINNIF